MPGLDISNSKRPGNLANIDDRNIQRDMREWVTFFEQFDNDLKRLQGEGAKLVRMSRDLNTKVAEKREERLPPEKDKPLKDLLERTAELTNALNRFLR